MSPIQRLNGTEIAIIGMAGRFPGAGDVDAFWRNIQRRVESITFHTDQELGEAGVDADTLGDPNFVRASARLADAHAFDAAFFGYSPREADLMDPQHRVLLEVAWEALENAGYNSSIYPGAIGVFAGATINTYLLLNLLSRPDLIKELDDVQINIANGGDFLTTRISYKLNLQGPSHLVQSACSTSLVATHLACQSLLNEECDLALSGGVSINEKLRWGYRYREGGMASPDGHCRAFDAGAAGTIFGGGAGLLVLKRYEDARADGDVIYALIKGSAINNDGAAKVGYTAPSVTGQARVIAEALANAGVGAESIGLVEAHGTGTPLGDPIELQALTKVFRAETERVGYCALGSVKTNIGHLDAAAGVAGMIKLVQALRYREIPPSLHFERPNPQIDLATSPFYISRQATQWNSGVTPRRAGVSAFGVGGTNAHIVLEEAPPASAGSTSRPWQLLLLSAKSNQALDAMTNNLGSYFRTNPQVSLADAAYTLQVGRQSFAHRRMAVCRDLAEATSVFMDRAPDRLYDGTASSEKNVVIMFPGQGAQTVNMSAGLYHVERGFRRDVDACAELLKPFMGLDLRSVIFPASGDEESARSRLSQTSITQPALFIIEYCLARLWERWGVQPAGYIGHSIGEYTAACLAGVLDLEDALRVVTIRGELMQGAPPGAMLGVGIAEDEARSLLSAGLSLAAVNGPSQCVISGVEEQVRELEELLRQDGVFCRRLQTSHAFHSDLTDGILEEFTQQMESVRLSPPRTPFISNLTGAWIKDDEATDPHYWGRHLRHTVRFADGVRTLLAEPDLVFFEVGPGQTLSRIVKRQAANRVVLWGRPEPGDAETDFPDALGALGLLWLHGVAPDWRSFYADEKRLRTPLPSYPFARTRHWIEPGIIHSARRPQETADLNRLSEVESGAEESVAPMPVRKFHPRPELPTAYVAPQSELEHRLAGFWREALGIEPIGLLDNFFALGGDSLLAVQVADRLKKELAMELPAVSLYEAVTIEALAKLLQGPGRSGETSDNERDDRARRRKQRQQQLRTRRKNAAA